MHAGLYACSAFILAIAAAVIVGGVIPPSAQVNCAGER